MSGNAFKRLPDLMEQRPVFPDTVLSSRTPHPIDADPLGPPRTWARKPQGVIRTPEKTDGQVDTLLACEIHVFGNACDRTVTRIPSFTG